MNINVKNTNAQNVVIDIEGVIGVDEQLQFSGETNGVRVSTFEKFRSAISMIEESGVETLRINIRSMGGSVQDALLIHSLLSDLPKSLRVETHCYGFSASAATIIAQAASPGCRYVASSAMYMIHRASTTFDGNAAQASSVAEILSKTDNQIASIYASRSGLSVEHFSEIMGRDGGDGQWLTAEEAVEVGLADEVENNASMRHIVNVVKSFFGKLSGSKVPKEVEPIIETEERTVVLDCEKTTTAPKEDPVVEHYSVSLKSNKQSYQKDVELFKGM